MKRRRIVDILVDVIECRRFKEFILFYTLLPDIMRALEKKWAKEDET